MKTALYQGGFFVSHQNRFPINYGAAQQEFVSLRLMTPALPDIYQVAIKASIEASEAIMEVYKEDFGVHIKADGSPVTEADIASSDIISRHLELTNIPILGEELEKDSFDVRSSWKENWCVDPLDGTKMFLQRNDEFCICIAHVVKGNPEFGIIASPVERKILAGGNGHGAFILDFDQVESPTNWEQLQPSNCFNDPIRVTCSRSYKHEYGSKHIDKLTGGKHEVIYQHKGSALKFFDLALGRADIYPRFAPTMEWDIAAGQAILEALEGKITNAHTQKRLTYNKEDLFNPHFIAKTKAYV